MGYGVVLYGPMPMGGEDDKVKSESIEDEVTD